MLSLELPSRSTDNSLTAPINWIYADEIENTSLPYHLLYLDLRLGTSIPELGKNVTVSYNYRTLKFDGSLDNAVLVYYKDSACLRVIHPDYDANNPLFPELISEAREFSNLERINVEPSQEVGLPTSVFVSEPEPGWCYYFERADLARQRGDWRQVVQLGDTAFNSGESPNHASEMVPFIQGYAITNKWNKAVKLSEDTLRSDQYMKPMLCSIWVDIADRTNPSDEQEKAIQNLQKVLNCPELKL